MLMLEPEKRTELWRRVIDAVEAYAAGVPTLHPAPELDPARPELDPARVRSLLEPFDFREPVDPLQAVDAVVDGLRRFQTHTPHPRYFGLFNPAPTTMGIAADALVAAFNPQLAAWSHSPFAVEVEQHLVRAFGGQFGYEPLQTEGTFCSGGAEANHTALITALTHALPEFVEQGVRALGASPVLYVSAEGHHSVHKAARLSGLGTAAVREIPVGEDLRLDLAALRSRIARDRAEGLAPFLVVATAGATSSGVIDPIAPVAEVAARERLWLHVDAAWGGAAVLVPELRALLEGVERADSLTFDAHKWLSVPMGAGLYLTRHPGILERTFGVGTAYMPLRPSTDLADPYLRSMQWSRRFIGLKLFLSLAVAGWEGYAAALRHQVAMGDRLRRGLVTSGWELVNDTPLPVVCFVDGTHPRGAAAESLEAIAGAVVSSGRAWISMTRVGRARPVLRACVTNYRTGPDDVDALVEALDQARQRAQV